MKILQRIFRLGDHGTTVAVELRAGATTFLTLAYILFVNPQILAQAGMPAAEVAFATAVSAAVACLLMGLTANYPFALAPGMGLNAFFTFGVVQGLGVSWQTALAAVLVAGILFVGLSLSGLRRLLLEAIPQPLQLAIMGGLGLFLALIGFENAGVVVDDPATLVTLGDLGDPAVQLALAGLALTGALLVARVRGALILAILGVSVVAWVGGVAPPPERLVSLPALPVETLFALDFSQLGSGPLLMAVLAFLFVDLFDTAGTLIGLGRLGGFTDPEGRLLKADRAFTADAVGTVTGALLGTSPVTAYVESATGIEEGGRTGLTAVTVAVLLLASLFVVPLVTAVPAIATAPALVAVGALMMQGLRELDWKRPEDALPAFLTVILMPATYSIATGIAFGIAAWVVLRLLTGRWRAVHPLLYALTAAFLVYLLLV